MKVKQLNKILPMVKFVMHNPTMKEYFKKVGLDTGWGNGYVAVSIDHPLYGMDCDEVWNTKFGGIGAHGGLTFSGKPEILGLQFPYDRGNQGSVCIMLDPVPLDFMENYWVMGFDTAHAWDTEEKCPKEYVIEQTIEFAKSIEVVCSNAKIFDHREVIVKHSEDYVRGFDKEEYR